MVTTYVYVYPTTTQKPGPVHEIPMTMLLTEEEVDSDAEESSDQVVPFQVRTKTW